MAFRASYIAVEAYRGFRRNLLLALSMVIIVAISLTLFGIALLAGKQVSLYAGYWTTKVEVSIFLANGITGDQRQSIQSDLDKLKANGVVQFYVYESKQEAFKRFKDQFKSSPDLVRNIGPDALPESFRVKLVHPTQFDLVHDEFCGGALDERGHEACKVGVDQIVDQKVLVQRLFTLLNKLKQGFLVLGLVLGAAAVTLIAVTVRVAAFARRKETQVMKLVGASNTYIRLPFLAEGVFAGLLGSAVAFGLLRLGMYYIVQLRGEVTIFQVMPIIGMGDFYSSFLILLTLGVIISALASLLALRKYVRV